MITDFGGKLRQARERRGVSLRQIAASTKISVAALEALERNDVSKLPGGIFTRAFVRSYAAEVGLDPDDTVREFLECFQAEPPPSGAVRMTVAAEESGFESQQRIAKVVLQLLVVSAVVVGLVLYFSFRNRSPAEQPAHGASAPNPADATPADRRAPAPVPAPQPAIAVLPSPADAALRAQAVDVIQLALDPTGPCWVSLTVDGTRVLSRLMQAGEHEVYLVRELAIIEIGDAGAFAFSLNGRPGRPLGETGQVRTARVTRATLSELVR